MSSEEYDARIEECLAAKDYAGAAALQSQFLQAEARNDSLANADAGDASHGAETGDQDHDLFRGTVLQ